MAEPLTTHFSNATNVSSTTEWETETTILLSYEQYVAAMSVLLTLQYLISPSAALVTAINIVVFTRSAMRSSTTKYVLALNVLQLVFLLMDIYFLLQNVLLPEPARWRFYWLLFIYYGIYAWAIIQRGAYWVMCLLSLERMYAVLRPLHVRSFLLSRFPLLAILACYLATAAFHFYIPAMLYVAQVGMDRDGSPLYSHAPTSFYLNNQDFLQAASLLAKVLFVYAPLLLLILLNLLTLWLLRRHRARSRSIKASGDEEAEVRRQRQLTVTILGSTAAYTVLSLPFALQSLVAAADPSYEQSSHVADRRLYWFYLLMQKVSLLCILLSQFTDFVSFVLLSSAYRRTLRSLLPRSCRRPEAKSTYTVWDSVQAAG